MHTYSALTVAFVNAKHGDISPQVAVTVGRLLADDDADRVRDAVGVCLWFTRQREGVRSSRDCSYEERKVGPGGGRRTC